MTPLHPASGISRRRLLIAAAPAAVAITAPTGLQANLAAPDGQAANVAAFGAVGDGVTDDGPAFRAALAAAKAVEVPVGRFRITAPLVLGDGQVLRGGGRSGWEPYSGEGPPASAIRSEIVVDAGLAIDARNTNNSAITGLALRARDARQSKWAHQPGFQSGTTGIDIAGSLQFQTTDVSFHGLEVGVAGIADAGRTAQMPHIGDWIAHDCGTVIRFVSKEPKFVPVRDARIEGCLAAIHCGRVIEARHCDGLRIENVRFFQCTANSLLIEGSQFVQIVGATLFETGSETIVLRNCQYVTISGSQLARAGFYNAPPYRQQAALLAQNCSSLSFEGLVEQPTGRAFSIHQCGNLSINAAIGTPFWTTGSLGSNDGAIVIERSQAIVLRTSFSGSDYWIGVLADEDSASSISGTISTAGSAGVVRCTQLQPSPLGHTTRSATQLAVMAKQSVELDAIRIRIPPGKSLVSRSIELTSPGLLFEAAGQRWQMEEFVSGATPLSLERKLLHHNETNTARYATIPIGVHNPTDRMISIPAGHEVRLSLALE
jgi:hypothetical protein